MAASRDLTAAGANVRVEQQKKSPDDGCDKREKSSHRDNDKLLKSKLPWQIGCTACRPPTNFSWTMWMTVDYSTSRETQWWSLSFTRKPMALLLPDWFSFVVISNLMTNSYSKKYSSLCKPAEDGRESLTITSSNSTQSLPSSSFWDYFTAQLSVLPQFPVFFFFPSLIYYLPALPALPQNFTTSIAQQLSTETSRNTIRVTISESRSFAFYSAQNACL